MIVHRVSKTPDDIFNTSFFDENNKLILEFEDKTHSIGKKIAVYDSDGNPVYLIDDTAAGEYTELTILQGLKEYAKIQIADNFFASYNVHIFSADGKYNFFFMRRALEKNGAIIVDLKPNFKKASGTLDTDAGDDEDKIQKSNLGILRMVRKGQVSLLNHIDFNIHTDDIESIKLYITLLYVIQFLVIDKVTSLMK